MKIDKSEIKNYIFSLRNKKVEVFCYNGCTIIGECIGYCGFFLVLETDIGLRKIHFKDIIAIGKIIISIKGMN